MVARHSLKATVTVVVPALNEERNISDALQTVLDALEGVVGAFEIVVIDDASTDRTPQIAEEFATRDSRIRVLRNPRNMGLGYNYRLGVEAARYEYVIMVPGDNETPKDTIRAIVESAGDTDIVVTYVTNPEVRPLKRRVVSRLFVWIVSLLFGLRLRYYNGNSIIRREVLLTIPLEVKGPAYMAAYLVRLLKRGFTYKEIGVQLQRREFGRSKIFRLKNVVSVGKTLLVLFWQVRLRPRRG